MGVPISSTDGASCVYVPQWAGMPEDQLAATVANIVIAVVGVLSLVYYGAHHYLSTCGWQEVYVCIVERKCVSMGSMCNICHKRQCMQLSWSDVSSATDSAMQCLLPAAINLMVKAPRHAAACGVHLVFDL
jgi:hypothetical protein